MLSGPFVVQEEEELIAQDRPTKGATKNCLRVRADRSNGDSVIVGPGIGIEVLQFSRKK